MTVVRSDEGELGFWGRVLRRRWQTVLAIVLLAVVAVLGYVLLTGSSSTATARLVVRDGDPAAEAQFLGSNFARDAAAGALGFAPEVDVAGGTAGSILTVTARAETVPEAVRVANTYAQTAVELRARTEGEERARVAETQANQLADVERRLAAPGLSQREITDLDQQRAAFQQAAPATPIPSVLAPAASADASSTDPGLYAVVAAVVGLLAGLAVAGVREHTDPRVRGAEQAAAALSAPSLGSAPGTDEPGPIMRWWRRLLRLSQRGDTVTSPGTAEADSYSLIRRRLEVRGDVKPHGSVQVVAADATDSARAVTVGLNLCLSFARVGHRSLLVCADFREPDTCLQMLHHYTEEGRGLGDVLAGLPPGEAVQTSMPADLLVLPAGTVPPAPFEALASDRFTDVLSDVRMLADVVVVLTPPLNAHPDGLAVAEHVDSRIVVASPASRTAELERAGQGLERSGRSADAVVFAGGDGRG